MIRNPLPRYTWQKKVRFHLKYSAEKASWLTCVALLLRALQIKELGIYFADCPQIAKTVDVYFQNLLTLSTINSTSYTKQSWDKQWQVSRKVPCWSHFLQPKERCRFQVCISLCSLHLYYLVHKFEEKNGYINGNRLCTICLLGYLICICLNFDPALILKMLGTYYPLYLF